MPGREADFERFFLDNREQLVGLAFLWSGDRQDACDLAQETLLRVWRHWGELQDHPNPEAWARTVLHNLCSSRWRRRRIERRSSIATKQDLQSSPSAEDLARTTDSNEIARLVATLEPRQRRALVLHDVIGLSVREIAVEMRAKEGTIRSWLSRSREVLRQQLESRSGSTRRDGTER